MSHKEINYPGMVGTLQAVANALIEAAKDVQSANPAIRSAALNRLEWATDKAEQVEADYQAQVSANTAYWDEERATREAREAKA